MIFIFLFFVFIFGVSIGSFLNVLIDRLSNDQKITGRSHCDFCHHQLAGWDLIPIISFFLLGGRCRYCRHKISFQYPLVEFLTGISFIFVFLLIVGFQQENLTGFFETKDWLSNLWLILLIIISWGIVSSLIVIFFSDLKYQLISDYILWSFFGFSFFYKIISIFLNKTVVVNEVLKQVQIGFLNGLVVCLPIFLIYFFSHERAMGLGDAYLSAIIGFLLGWQKGFLALYFAFVLGGLVGFLLILLGRKKLKSKIAFGPFLVLGALIMFFFGSEIFSWLIRFYGG